MEKQYTFIMSSLANGRTVLAYDRRVTGYKTKRVTTSNQVRLDNSTLFIDGKDATGWTICLKP